MIQKISPLAPFNAAIRLPGDKSISHRYGMLTALAEGTSTIHNYSSGVDCHTTLKAMQSLGAKVSVDGVTVTVEGVGPRGLQAPGSAIDAGNSGTTMRLLSGILAGQHFDSEIFGDDSLNQRPMQRIMDPLRLMGAEIEGREGKYPPLRISGRTLSGIEYATPVASAQVKSCVLMAGLFAQGETVVEERIRTRDHTELALRAFGADIDVRGTRVTVRGGSPLKSLDLMVPSDLSSAAFFLAATLLIPGSSLRIQGVGLNPSRTALLDFLISMGANIRIVNLSQVNGEMMGDLQVRYGPLRGGVIDGDLPALLIDEIPVLAVLGAASRDGLTVRNASELRVKETDRIATVARNLRVLGADVEEYPDGFTVKPAVPFRSGVFESHGDHRIAMSFAVAALAATGESSIVDAECAGVSFPEFYTTVDQLRSPE
ncbi:MAG: 3-phosphoshikimate 1-carboxyvinyltransferase [Bryobacterales bacterium]|nr:3-phosphoshikimate 1-carboxyvinyltransferase [Bryobacterales bacterium]